jgi:hypothetical protein
MKNLYIAAITKPVRGTVLRGPASRAPTAPPGSLGMLRGVEEVTVWRSDEEAGHAPLLGGQRMHDLVGRCRGPSALVAATDPMIG